MKNGKILVGMSGGLDSTYTVSLLREAGYDVVGAALVFSDHTDTEGAKRAAAELSVPLLIHDVRPLFFERVVKDFRQCYVSGRTPNPCVVCNRFVKMQTLYELSLSEGCDGFATGHYAKPTVLANGRYAIAMGKDRKKDQSYMLWGMSQEQISRFVAPLAEMEKEVIRENAEKAGFSSARSAESQDICFIPDGDYVSFIANTFGREEGFEKGNFVDSAGNILGEHKGTVHYTVGQRKGLGIALGKPAFVTAMDPFSGNVTLSFAEDCYFSTVRVEELVFQGLAPMESGEFDAYVKIRYAAPAVACHVVIEGSGATVTFAEAQRTPAPGQSAVFYRDGYILMGGIIAAK